MSNKQNIVCVDRNILGQLLSAVKKGSFSGENRKETTAFLFFCMSSGFGISPYDAIKEQAFAKMIILVYLVQASCNIRTLVPVLFGREFL